MIRFDPEPKGPDKPFTCIHGVLMDRYFAVCLDCLKSRFGKQFASVEAAEEFLRRRYRARLIKEGRFLRASSTPNKPLG